MGCGFSNDDIWGFLANGLNAGASDIMDAIWHGIGGIGLDGLAALMQRVTNASPATIADALWHMDIQLDASNVVWALVNGIGVQLWDAWNIVNSL